jgi:integrase
LIASNPAAKADKPSQRKGRRTAPPDEVLAALIRAAQGDLLCYLRLSAVTGARRGQLVALRWSDLDLERGTVTFTRAHVVVKGGVAEKGTKTNHDYGVALDPGTVDLLKVHRVRCAERALAAGVGLRAEGFVFARANAPDGSEAWHPDGATQRFDRLRARVPGGADVTLHQLRHWMATSMFEAGFDPVAVAARGGWASPTVPMNVYGHFRKARDHDAAASLAARLDNKG